MASKLFFSGVVYRTVKGLPDITQSERNAGKLQALPITSRFEQGLKIDVLALKKGHTIIVDDSAEFSEDDIREGTRRTFTKLSELFIRKGRLPVHANFFRELKEGDTIEIILHS